MEAQVDVADKETEISELLKSALSNEAVKEEFAGEADAEGNYDNDEILTALDDAFDAAATALNLDVDFNDLKPVQQTALIKQGTTALEQAVAVAQADVDAAREGKDGISSKLARGVDTLNSRLDAYNVAVDAADTAEGKMETELAVIDALLASKDVELDEADYADATAVVYDKADGNVALITKTATGWSVDKDLPLANGVYTVGGDTIEASRLELLVAALNATEKAVKAETAAENSLVNAYNSLMSAFDSGFTPEEDINEIVAAGDFKATIFNDSDGGTQLADYIDLVSDLREAQTDLQTFNDNLDTWKEIGSIVAEYEALDDELTELGEAVEKALAAIANDPEDEEAPGLGIEVVTVDDLGNALFGLGDDLMVFNGKAVIADGFGDDGNDSIYIGNDFSLFIADKGAKIKDSLGDINDLEVIVIDNGTDTTLYFENFEFAGNATNAGDMVQVTLAGVTGESFELVDGFLTIA